MNKSIFTSILGTLLLLLMGTSELSAQARISQWKGFTRHDMSFEERPLRIIVPDQALPGNPWLWRARFPDWHTEADSMLVAAGFHLVYLNTDNLYGSPEAVASWNSLYKFVRTTYQLNAKVALAGVSRGGLFVYNWAKENPEKVACIYAEAPVCDFTSWPGGFGAGEGSPKNWDQLKTVYGFTSDEAAKAYENNPIDQLEALAKSKVPILHMISLQDQVVPPNENTFVLLDTYLKLGGPATVVPCTRGEQKLKGHHFPIETPRRVADFILYHANPTPLAAALYHQPRGSLENCRIQFEQHKEGRVAFLGGSITYNPGWRDSVSAYLQKRFPDTKFEFIAAGIPSMGTTPAAFRLERDVLSNGRIDLLFEEAAVNDAGNGRSDSEQVKAMEGIIRHTRIKNPKADIVMMHFVDPGKMKAYRSGKVPEVIRNHNQVAAHYGISTINLAKEVTDRIDQGEFSWEEDFKNLHPSPFGQGVYAHSMIRFLEHVFDESQDAQATGSPHTLPEKLDPFCYDTGVLLDISTAKRGKGWKIDPDWAPTDSTGVRANYTQVPMLISEKPGSTLRLPFTGSAVGIAVAAGQDAGMIEYRIDKGEWQQQNLFTRWSKHLHLPWYYTLADNLSPTEHTLSIRIAQEKDEQSSGQACRIRYFFANQ